ncbi:alpha/beta hydrolase [Amycolatopsis sp. NPDC023774]|uniref:alpha/beta fold hydrolase n=1 Tax=Amycolatopsis sp. NPDC023774 TaxID=3155015 RepID=UPI0034098FFA
MTDFVLVHGSWHGAWCWERLIPELAALGHHAVAADLGLARPGATFDSLVEAVERTLAAPGQTVLVAHSGGAAIAPLVASRRPVRELVLLAPIVPGEPAAIAPGFAEALARQGRTEDGVAWDSDDAYDLFYQDCERADANSAIERLVPHRIGALAPGVHHAHPGVPTRHIVCTADRAIDPRESARLTHERYGASIVELAASHSPFWSRPRELARLLADTPQPAR